MDAEPWEVHEGSCLEVLPRLPAGLAQTCCTSPPYYGLRDYGTAKWEGGDSACDHQAPPLGGIGRETITGGKDTQHTTRRTQYPRTCEKCGAVRGGSDWPAVEYAPMPGLPPVAVPAMRCELGLEPTPEAYVGHLVLVFRQVRRVLRPDGLLALNLGDSYASSGTYDRSASERLHAWQGDGKRRQAGPKTSGGGKGSASCPSDLKPKDLLGIPWRVAFALQSDGWWLRSDVIWAKLSPMPQSVRDRPTAAHEYVFLLAPSATYFYDQDAERMPLAEASEGRYRYAFGGAKAVALAEADVDGMGVRTRPIGEREPTDGRNLWTHWQDIEPEERDFWEDIPSEPSRHSHYAAFPTKLARRALRLGSSEKGGCPHCGAPWRRVTERRRKATRPDLSSKYGTPEEDIRGGSPTLRRRMITTSSTTGWEPSCGCPAHEPIPQTILDPFCGSGSTGVASRGAGRHFVGVELSPEYAALSRRRISAVCPLLDTAAKAVSAQRSLFDLSPESPEPKEGN
jgi:hypothetical protein